MGALMRALDWSGTRLGAPETWPQSLRTSISICLDCHFPILVWWGPELVMLYNDDYRPMLGGKHPASLGQRGRECWPEIWHIIGPMLEGVLSTGEATRSEDLLLLLESNFYPEERYFSFSYSPIQDETGGVGGVFTPVKETTEKVVGERRLRTVLDLAGRARGARDFDQACRLAAETLEENPFDLPFALLYRIAPEADRAWLVASAGIAAGSPASPEEISLGQDEGNQTWPLAEIVRTGAAVGVNDLGTRFRGLPSGGWGTAPEAARLIPILFTLRVRRRW
jgi:PAS domain-containing protein